MGDAVRDYPTHYQWLRSLTDGRSELERTVLDHLYQTQRRLPDYAQYQAPNAMAVPDFFYKPNVCVYCDGTVHDEPQQRAIDEASRRELKALGYRVIVLRYDADLEAMLTQHADVFGQPGGRTMTHALPGALVQYREREWVVLPSDDPGLVLLRPIGGSTRETCGVVRTLADQAAYSLPYERIRQRTSRCLRLTTYRIWRQCAWSWNRRGCCCATAPRPFVRLAIFRCGPAPTNSCRW